MRKIFLVLVFVVLLLGIFSAAEEIGGAPTSVSEVKFVQDFVSKSGIQESDIKSIESVDFNALPKEVNIENVGDNNLAVYEVNYTSEQGAEKVYVVAYSVDKLEAQGDLIVAQDKRNFLNFGYDGLMSSSGFLETATGTETSLEKGYVMPRDGSITAVSTNLEIVNREAGAVEIVVYVNGQAANFGNMIDASSAGVKKDYDVQSKDTVSFSAGDVVSVYASTQGNISLKDVITIVEITTSN